IGVDQAVRNRACPPERRRRRPIPTLWGAHRPHPKTAAPGLRRMVSAGVIADTRISAAATMHRKRTMKWWRKLALAATLSASVLGQPGFANAQSKPEGEMRFALYVTLAPAWLDPGEATPGFVTSFWVLYALHD